MLKWHGWVLKGKHIHDRSCMMYDDDDDDDDRYKLLIIIIMIIIIVGQGAFVAGLGYDAKLLKCLVAKAAGSH